MTNLNQNYSVRATLGAKAPAPKKRWFAGSTRPTTRSSPGTQDHKGSSDTRGILRTRTRLLHKEHAWWPPLLPAHKHVELLPSSIIEVRVFSASKMGSSPDELRRSPILRSSNL